MSEPPTAQHRARCEEHAGQVWQRRHHDELAQSLRYRRQSCDPSIIYMAPNETAFCDGRLLCELHLHLEGSVSPATLRLLDPGLSAEQAASPYRFTDFAGFIECFKFIAVRLRTPEDYARITTQLIAHLAAQGVSYAEVTLAAGVLLW